ncbi:MAG: DnaJ domain-containing protein [Desulfobacula sp.]|jgi:hypothetical protein|nr:DnaJ domain-containing protein [Desulfobacula sp.]
MNLYVKIILILFAIAYLISPVDIIPDILLPYVGWIDDGVILWTIYYLIRYGKLPWFFFKKKSTQGNSSGRKTSQANPGQTEQNSFDKNKTRNSKNTTSKNTTERKIPKSPYEILGISSNASSKEIQEAYKTKIKLYHPDKLSHLGEEFSNLANEKFLEIQRAYETLKAKTNH